MEQYIPKSALVAEINKRILYVSVDCYGYQRVCAYNDIKDIIDALEVKEVDLEKEEERIWKDFNMAEFHLSKNDLEKIAKHFFELGLKIQKGE